MNILDYNNALNAYNASPNATTYNNALNFIPQQTVSGNPVGRGYVSPAAVANTAPTATGGSGNPLADYQSILDSLNNNTNNYFGQQAGFYQNNFQNQQNLYNSQNTQSLGTQDQGAKDAFLNAVLSPDQKQQGSIEYGYNMNLGHDNNVYGLNTTNNQQNRDLALAKLANDENYALQGLGLQQGNQNASTIDSLNQRGLLYGQSPTGAYQPTAMGGMNGLAGFLAGRTNQDFGIQRGQLTGDYGLNVKGANQDWQQQQNMLDENHNYDQKNLAFGAANDVNNQNNQYTFNSAQNNNQLAQYKASLNNQQQQQLNNNTQTAYTKSLLKNNAYTAMS